MGKYFYCPFCGATQFPDRTICVHCRRNVVLSESNNDSSYYREKAVEMYGDIKKWHDILFWEEVVNNPMYDEEAKNYIISEKEHQKILNDIFSGQNRVTIHTPKCPTCQSPNIHKLSVTKRMTHGLAFGLFSKTARSQWECKDCGNKW